jgi:hypothetical protein
MRNARYHAYIGADPELFIERGDGSLFPSFEFLPEKYEYNHASGHLATYWDGYQAEFAFTPTSCIETLGNYIQRGLRQVLAKAREKDPKAKLSVRTTVDIPFERLTSDDPKFVAFGCHPSLNAYDDKVPKQEGNEVPFRSSGGHLHFAIDEPMRKYIPKMVKELDRVLGVISVAMFQYYDESRRRLLYGRAGEYRLPSYGFEYRVLSSAWMLHPSLVHFVYEMARHIIGGVKGGKRLKWWDVTEEEARNCINNCDVGLAHMLMDRNRDSLKALLLAMPRLATMPMEFVENVIDGPLKQGVHTALRNPDEFSSAWLLNTEGPAQMGTIGRWSTGFSDYSQHGYFD